jgi:glycosyl transferase family 10 (putative fucosyltransferase)
MSIRQLPIPVQLQKNHLLVLAWNDHYFGADYFDTIIVENPDGSDITLQWTTNRADIGAADAVWFHAPTITDMPPLADKQQPWVLMSMESDVNYPALKQPYARFAFDILMTYRLDADIPCIYPNWKQYGSFLEPPPKRRGRSTGALAAYIASHPVKYRDTYVEQLMKYMRVDCLGRCLRNRRIEDFLSEGLDQRASENILRVLPHYKFYLAFENSRTTDYVTERVFLSLVCGTVPIYFGAENIQDFMPANNAVIVASDYGSPKELANHLNYLDGDDEAYHSHLRWKSEGYKESFKSMVDLGSRDPKERLAIKLAHGCGRECCCGGRVR